MEATFYPSLRLHALISARSDEATANEAVSALEEMFKGKVISETNHLATKSDLLEGLAGVRKELVEGLAGVKSDLRKELVEGLALVRQEIAESKAAVRQEIAESKAAVRQEIAESKAAIRQEIAESKAEMIKWMFIFWIGQMVVTFGFILLFLKK